jgi:hypothetical protein
VQQLVDGESLLRRPVLARSTIRHCTFRQLVDPSGVA